jgi:hypothetical protein
MFRGAGGRGVAVELVNAGGSACATLLRQNLVATRQVAAL